MNEKLFGILRYFQLDGEPVSCEPYGCGHINHTYLAITTSGRRYILQRINHNTFKNVEALMENIKDKLSDSCIDFGGDRNEEFYESLAMCEEALLDQYLETGEVAEEEIPRLITERKAFPGYFGSALKLDGVETLLDALLEYTKEPAYDGQFGAKVFKISRDDQGNRLTHLKVTGGSLKVKDLMTGTVEEEVWEEKINQIRL